MHSLLAQFATFQKAYAQGLPFFVYLTVGLFVCLFVCLFVSGFVVVVAVFVIFQFFFCRKVHRWV